MSMIVSAGWSLYSSLTVPSWRFARPSAVRASGIVLPARSGTGTGLGPNDGTSVTVAPFSSVVPGSGSMLATLPAGMFRR